MNEEIEKAIDALSGGKVAGGNAGGDAVDWKAKYEEMERKFQSAQVEQGRVKKLDEENKALQRRLEEAEASRRSQSIIDDLPDDLKRDVPDDYMRVQAEIARRTADLARKDQDERYAALERRIAEREQREADEMHRQVAMRIDQEFPGFLKRAVSETGDLHAAWTQYLRYHAPSVNSAFASGNIDILFWHIRNFYNTEVGIPPPSGGTGAAAPDPSPTGGGQRVHAETGKIYTAQEYAELEKKAMQLRRMGDFEGYRKLDAELNNILTEGRVKD